MDAGGVTHRIVPGRLEHVRVLARAMRAEDRAEIKIMGPGVAPRHFLHMLYRESVECCAAVVDGEVAAVWGVLGPLLASDARVWLFTAPAVERVPLAFFREARAWVAQTLERYRTVTSTCAASYERSVRFYAMVGFEVGAPYRHGSGMVRDMVMRRPVPQSLRIAA